MDVSKLTFAMIVGALVVMLIATAILVAERDWFFVLVMILPIKYAAGIIKDYVKK